MGGWIIGGVGGDLHGIAVGEARTVLHIRANVIRGVGQRQGEGGREGIDFGIVVDFHQCGVDVGEVRRTEQAVAETLFHVVVAAAVVGYHGIDSQLFVGVRIIGDGGDCSTVFGASGQQDCRTKTECH